MPKDATNASLRGAMNSTNKSADFIVQIKVPTSRQNLRLLALDCANAHPEDDVPCLPMLWITSLKSSPCLLVAAAAWRRPSHRNQRAESGI